MKNKLIWNSHIITIKESVISKPLINKMVNKFWKDKIVNQIPDNHHIICLFRIKTVNNIISTLGDLVKLNINDQKYYIDYIDSILALKGDEYKNITISEIIFSYGFRKGEAAEKPNFQKIRENVMFQNYRHFKLPITLDPLKYGKILTIYSEEQEFCKDNYTTNFEDKSDNNPGEVFMIQITPKTIAKIINRPWEGNDVFIYREGNLILNYFDYITDEGFIRKLGKNKFYYNLNGELQLFTKDIPLKYIKSINKAKELDNNFMTMDIETKIVDNKHSPYLIAWYDGQNSKNFFVTDYKSQQDMIEKCILSICNYKYNNIKIYIHNLANFDGIFLLKILAKLGEVKVLMNNDQLISFDFTYKINTDKEITLCFRDSYQILLSSLRKLCKSFNVNNPKTIFPYEFVNKNYLNYSGTIPKLKYFDNITIDEYNSYKKQINGLWNLKNEAIKYCIIDCISLYEVIEKFNQLIFDKFKLNINMHPTLPSLAFRLFRSKYIKKDVIQQVTGKIYEDIRESYTGGATDMYIPTNKKVETVYGYDVNSLYPYIMTNYKMPVSINYYFEGDIRKFDPNAYGFFYCKINVPDNIDHPILQTHVHTKNGIRTIAGTGTYYDFIYSPSMDSAVKLGYTFEIMRGYTFNSEFIFKKYVNDLYNMRLKYPKTDPMNYLAKILLNSLYGKFGMREEFDKVKIINKKEFEKLDTKNVNNIIQLDEKFLIKIKENKKPFEFKDVNINIGVASAITSLARDYMAQFKNHPKLKLFYTDTDSIYTNLNPAQMNELFPGIVNPKGLGKLKLENENKKAIFLSPKCYGLLNTDNEFNFKVKGLSKEVNLNIENFESLLIKGFKIEKSQNKVYKSLSDGSISVINQMYTLQQTDNKRKLIYRNKKLINTKPYKIPSNKEINKQP